MYSKQAHIYDAIYAHQDYAGQARRVHQLIQTNKRSPGNRLLDVACGTGLHLKHWQEDYEVAGLDISEEMLAVARERLPNVPLHAADMADFDLGTRFDAITCLFSSIGHLLSEDLLRQAIATMAGHLEPGGVLVVEAWLTPDEWREGYLNLDHVNLPNLKIARMSLSRSEGHVSILDMHHLVGTPEGVEYFVEPLHASMFTVQQYIASFQAAGLDAQHDPEGLRGRGLYVAVKPLA